MGVQANVTVTSNTHQVGDDITDGLVAGLNKAAERLLTLSSAEAPLEIGTLIGSGTVLPASADMSAPASSVVFDTPYAARLHEHPEFNFQNGRKGKYLEDPALQNKDELGAIVAAEVRRG